MPLCTPSNFRAHHNLQTQRRHRRFRRRRHRRLRGRSASRLSRRHRLISFITIDISSRRNAGSRSPNKLFAIRTRLTTSSNSSASARIAAGTAGCAFGVALGDSCCRPSVTGPSPKGLFSASNSRAEMPRESASFLISVVGFGPIANKMERVKIKCACHHEKSEPHYKSVPTSMSANASRARIRGINFDVDEMVNGDPRMRKVTRNTRAERYASLIRSVRGDIEKARPSRYGCATRRGRS
jgi:hypothetical protein